MSEQIDTPSPDYIETTQGPGTKRVNRLPIVIVGTVVAVFLLVMGYNMYDKSAIRQATAAAALESNKITSAKPPVDRPAGPDVSMARPVVYDNSMPGEVQQPGAPLQESEAEKRTRERKVAALEAALISDPRVENFFANSQAAVTPVSTGNSNPQQRSVGVPPPPRIGQVDDGMGGMVGGNDSPVRNHAGFAQNSDNDIYLSHRRDAPISPLVINAGNIIPGVMVTGINSDLPGPIVGRVSRTVYDSATGRIPLIPAGAELNGFYDSHVVAGEERVLVAWNNIKFPDSSTLMLGNMPGADQSGMAGFNDQVDNHYMRTFGQALLLSALSAGMQIGQQPRGSANGQLSATQIAAAATAMQFGMLGMQSARRGLNSPPTMVIRPGFQFNIMVTKDIILPPWRGHPVAQAQVNQGGSEDEVN